MNEKEYLMLRDEILHLDEVIVQTIAFFYSFIAGYMVFALSHRDTIYIILYCYSARLFACCEQSAGNV